MTMFSRVRKTLRRKFSISINEYAKHLYTPLGAVSVDRYESKIKPRWDFSRGRVQERIIRVPLTKTHTLELNSRGKSYLDLVGAPEFLKSMDWIVDEFDASFNALATASLRYHMDHAVTYCTDERRAQYQDIIDRLNPPKVKMFDPGEEDIENRWLSSRDSWLNKLRGTNFSTLNVPDEFDEYMERYRDRQKERDAVIDKARHDFADIMRGLWS